MLNLDAYARLRPMLYHGTAQENFSSIQHHRTLFSAALLAPERRYIKRGGAEPVMFGDRIVLLRDQLALRKHQMELEGGWSCGDLLAALNSRVFFWPGNQDGPNRYGCNFVEAYGNRDKRLLLLRVPFDDMRRANPDVTAYFCKVNSGAPRMSAGRKSGRGPGTFRIAEEWHDPPSRVAEVSFVGKIIVPASTEVWDEPAGWRSL
jgi:hypothetical protein